MWWLPKNTSEEQVPVRGKKYFNLNNNAGTETKGYNQPWVWIGIRDTNH